MENYSLVCRPCESDAHISVERLPVQPRDKVIAVVLEEDMEGARPLVADLCMCVCVCVCVCVGLCVCVICLVFNRS